MITLDKDLNPSKLYSFQTELSSKTPPMRVKEFLDSSFAPEKLIAVNSVDSIASNTIWSIYDGWNACEFAALVSQFVSFIDSTQEINPEFIDNAILDELPVNEAVSSWFLGSDLSIEISHHLSGASGLIDIDFQGVGSTRRVVLSMDVKRGDMFNIYYGKSSKGGGVWEIDLKTSIANYFNNSAKESS